MQHNETINQFKKFMLDEEAHELYITGMAGTGKTTELGDLLEYCKAEGIVAITCAYTHKAVGVLRTKLPKGADTCTLHSFLKKRPTINDRAEEIKHLDGNVQVDAPEKPDVVFIDEFSMVGERDYMSLMELVYDDDGNVITKLIFIGDVNQLPPVKDQQTIRPNGNHQVRLTKIHRQAEGNPLIDTLVQLNSFISGSRAIPLAEHERFQRGIDIVKAYMECKHSKIMLAYTNARVQSLNAEVQGRDAPWVDDELFSPTLRQQYKMLTMIPRQDIGLIISITDKVLELNSKYKTLETLIDMADVGVEFMVLEDEEGDEMPRAVVFGHDSFLKASQELGKEAVAINFAIKAKFGEDPKQWAAENWRHEMAKKRQAAWKRFLAFKEHVICVDFIHATTVHKSQGSTYHSVFFDIQDAGKCADSDYQMYLKLLYVAISRASHMVYTN